MATSIATQNAFDRALDTYKKELNAKELRRITTPVSLDNVLATARDICEKHEKGDRRKTIRIFQQLDKARERLEPFNNVLTGLCKLPPYGGDLIWGSVSLTLQVRVYSSFDWVEIWERRTHAAKGSLYPLTPDSLSKITTNHSQLFWITLHQLAR